MKKLLTSVCLLLIISACDKKDKNIDGPEDTSAKTTGPLTGKWQYVEVYRSSGPGGNWTKVENGAFMNINADSTYEVMAGTANLPFLQKFAKTHKGLLSNAPLVNSSPSLAYLVNTESKDTMPLFKKIVNQNDVLDIALPCYEACIFRFIKIKN